MALACAGSDAAEAGPTPVPPFSASPASLPESSAARGGAAGSPAEATASGGTPSGEGPSNDLPIASGAGGATGALDEVGAAGAASSTPAGGTSAEGGAPTGSGQGGTSPAGPLPDITIWIAGDSTVANGNTPCPRGWGGVFKPHFDERVTVNNAAVGGRSVHTWLYNVQDVIDEATDECALELDSNGNPVLQPRWQTMLDGMQAGDYLFIQFGINDGDPSCDRHVGIEAFKTAYGMMAQAARERGAQPVFLTPVSSIACNGSTARGSRGGFVPATEEVGAELDVPVIDLHARSVALFQSLAFCPVAGGDVSAATTGPVGDFFCDDHTHFSDTGALQIADLVVQALTEQNIPLAAYLR